jgi:hypothetical protein
MFLITEAYLHDYVENEGPNAAELLEGIDPAFQKELLAELKIINEEMQKYCIDESPDKTAFNYEDWAPKLTLFLAALEIMIQVTEYLYFDGFDPELVNTIQLFIEEYSGHISLKSIMFITPIAGGSSTQTWLPQRSLHEEKSDTDESVTMECDYAAVNPPLISATIPVFSTPAILASLLTPPDTVRASSISTDSDTMECDEVLPESPRAISPVPFSITDLFALKNKLKISDEKLTSSIHELKVALMQFEQNNNEIAQQHVSILQSRHGNKNLWIRDIVYRDAALTLTPFPTMVDNEEPIEGAEYLDIHTSVLLKHVNEADAFASTDSNEEFPEQKLLIEQPCEIAQENRMTEITAQKRINDLFSSLHHTRPKQISARAAGLNHDSKVPVLQLSDKLKVTKHAYTLKSKYLDSCSSRYEHFLAYVNQAQINYLTVKAENDLLKAKLQELNIILTMPVRLPPPPGFSPRDDRNNAALANLRCTSQPSPYSLFTPPATELPSRCSTPAPVQSAFHPL